MREFPFPSLLTIPTTCIGTTLQAQKCNNAISQANQHVAREVLSVIQRSGTQEEVDNCLDELAAALLCRRNHQNQISVVVDSWRGTQGHVQTTRSSAKGHGRTDSLQPNNVQAHHHTTPSEQTPIKLSSRPEDLKGFATKDNGDRYPLFDSPKQLEAATQELRRYSEAALQKQDDLREDNRKLRARNDMKDMQIRRLEKQADTDAANSVLATKKTAELHEQLVKAEGKIACLTGQIGNLHIRMQMFKEDQVRMQKEYEEEKERCEEANTLLKEAQKAYVVTLAANDAAIAALVKRAEEAELEAASVRETQVVAEEPKAVPNDRTLTATSENSGT